MSVLSSLTFDLLSTATAEAFGDCVEGEPPGGRLAAATERAVAAATDLALEIEQAMTDASRPRRHLVAFRERVAVDLYRLLAPPE